MSAAKRLLPGRRRHVPPEVSWPPGGQGARVLQSCSQLCIACSVQEARWMSSCSLKA